MREFPFELALCAHLEAHEDWIIARQIGAGVREPSNRIVDVLCAEPGPKMDARTALTPETVPAAAVESDVGVGRARDPSEAIDAHPERARRLAERAVEVGFFERAVGGGVRQVARYPDDWFGRLVGVENKPDLGEPGDLRTQLRKDASLALLDEVILATESYVTGAHLNRIPDSVGVWRFDPETGDREVVREAEPLSTGGPGVELLERHAGRTDVAIVSADEKARQRRRMAERAYGKGWRTYEFPECAEVESATRDGASREQPATGPDGDDGLPHCEWKGRVVNPANCGPDCPGHAPADPPEFDPDEARDARSPWVADPEGEARRQSGLDRFL